MSLAGVIARRRIHCIAERGAPRDPALELSFTERAREDRDIAGDDLALRLPLIDRRFECTGDRALGDERSASRLAPLGFARQREGDLFDVAPPQIANGASGVAGEKAGFEPRAFPEGNGEDPAVGLTFCVDENVFTEASRNFFAGECIGDRAAKRGVDFRAGPFQRAIGKEGHDQRSGMHRSGRIVNKTNLHGEPFGR